MLTKIPHPQKRPHITKVCGVTNWYNCFLNNYRPI